MSAPPTPTGTFALGDIGGGAPTYRYADEIATPTELGIRRDGSVGGIMRAVGGINYYVDKIGFGHSSGFARQMGMHQKPMGLRYFLKTGIKCSNGQDMYEYMNNVPTDFSKPCDPGDASCSAVRSVIGSRVPDAIQAAVGTPFQGLAPGIMGDAVAGLNPVPLLSAVGGKGVFPKCKRVELPVGNTNYEIRSAATNEVWIPDSDVRYVDGVPHLARWVYDRDLTQDEYNAEFAATTRRPEGFMDFEGGPGIPTIAAGVLLAGLALGIYSYMGRR